MSWSREVLCTARDAGVALEFMGWLAQWQDQIENMENSVSFSGTKKKD